MKIFVDDVREAPDGYALVRSVCDAIELITEVCSSGEKIELISLDHDAGDNYVDGGDFIEILNWLEEIKYQTGYEPCTNFQIHSANPVGRQNMERIINRCDWQLI